MNLPNLLEEFNIVLNTPEGLNELRSLILGLAVRGKLVPQDPNDEPASELLKKIEAEKDRLYEEGEIRKPKKVRKISVDEYPFQIPNNWVWTNLNEAGVINPRNDAKDDVDTSFISMSLISEGFMEMHDSEKRKWKEIKSGYTHFAENDVGLAKITPCFQNGKAAIFRNLTNGIGAGTTELYIFRSVLEGLIPEYVYAFLRTPDFVNQGVEEMTGTAGQQRVPKGYFEHRPFPLPPANEQHRIVQKIESLFAEVDELETKLNRQTKLDEKLQMAVNAEVRQAPDADASQSAWTFITSNFSTLYHTPEAIDNLKKNILNEAVRGRLVPQNPNDEPASELLKKIEAEKHRLYEDGEIRKPKELPPVKEDEVPFEIPESWEWCRFEDSINELKGGYAYKSGKMIKNSDNQVIRLGNVKNEGLQLDRNPAFITDEYASNTENYKLEENDILITMTGTREKKDYCFTAVVRNEDLEDRKLYLNQRVGLFKLSDFSDVELYNHFLKSNSLLEGLFESATGTANQANISMKSISNLLFPVPPLEEQHHIVQRIEELFAICDRFKEHLEQREKVNDRLMKGLVGEVLEEASSLEKEQVQDKEIAVAAEPEEAHLTKQQIAFIQILCIAHALYVLRKKNMLQGEMGLAKYIYLMDRIGGVNTYFRFEQNNFGPYPSNFRKRLFTKSKYFYKTGSKGYEIINLTNKSDRLFERESEQTEQIQNSMQNLTEIFEPFQKNRAHKLELLASVCWLIEKTGQTDFDIIWDELKNWETPKREGVDCKADLFTDNEVRKTLEFIEKKGWPQNLKSHE